LNASRPNKNLRNRSVSSIQLHQQEVDSFSALHEDNLSKIDMPPSYQEFDRINHFQTFLHDSDQEDHMADDLNHAKTNTTPYIYNRTTVMEGNNNFIEQP
jgi:hypothetical protein